MFLIVGVTIRCEWVTSFIKKNKDLLKSDLHNTIVEVSVQEESKTTQIKTTIIVKTIDVDPLSHNWLDPG